MRLGTSYYLQSNIVEAFDDVLTSFLGFKVLAEPVSRTTGHVVARAGRSRVRILFSFVRLAKILTVLLPLQMVFVLHALTRACKPAPTRGYR